MNRREAIVVGLCALLLKPLSALAAWFKRPKRKPKVNRNWTFVCDDNRRGPVLYDGLDDDPGTTGDGATEYTYNGNDLERRNTT